MDYTVKPLNENLSQDFVDFLNSLSFDHSPHWASCYCRYYHTNCSQEEWQKRTGKENRKEAIKEIKAGNMQGYLAFHEDKCIGWCNANEAEQFIRLKEQMEPIIKDKKVGCVICFVVHPQYRRQGVARMLLKRAIKDFKLEGFEAVLAIPLENKNEPEKQYRGTVKMFEEEGFQEIEKHGNLSVMWLEL